MPKLLFRGRICHSLSPTKLEIIPDALLGVDNGMVSFLYEYADVDNADLEQFLRNEGYADAEYVQLTKHQFLFPGLIDTHIHAPQYPNAGFGMDVPLLEWLEKYTFPTESSMSDPALAKRVFGKLVAQTLRQGTTLACYYSSIHTEATNILANLCLSVGQRAFIGKCNMDRLSPDHYRETCQESLDATKACINHVRSIDPSGEQLTYCITPRFAPSCSSEMMHALGALAKAESLPIQTHISENRDELKMVKDLFPSAPSYTELYHQHGLLTNRTILAHAIHISADEISLIKATGAGIAHCPASNTSISSGECPVRELLNNEVSVGLGTDVSGGYTASILDSARLACAVSRHRVIHSGDKSLSLGVPEALYMATLGGARVCNLEARLGNFATGKYFDALLIDLGPDRKGRVDIFDGESDEKMIEKWVFNGDDRNINRIYIDGKIVLQS